MPLRFEATRRTVEDLVPLFDVPALDGVCDADAGAFLTAVFGAAFFFCTVCAPEIAVTHNINPAAKAPHRTLLIGKDIVTEVHDS